jgi:hypothetical protein
MAATHASPAHAASRLKTEDAVVVEQAALIVVGHVREGASGGGSSNKRAILTITEVLKGESATKEIAVAFHGLYLKVGSRTPGVDPKLPGNEECRGPIGIHDGVLVRFGPVIKDRALQDPRERVAKLLPYYLDGVSWCGRPEARQGLIDCGDVAGPVLAELFEDPNHARRRPDIIEMWGAMRYAGAVDRLVHLLKVADPRLPEKRGEVYFETVHAVRSLGKIGDSRAIEALKLTQRRWRELGTDHARQIIEDCDAALKAVRQMRAF